MALGTGSSSSSSAMVVAASASGRPGIPHPPAHGRLPSTAHCQRLAPPHHQHQRHQPPDRPGKRRRGKRLGFVEQDATADVERRYFPSASTDPHVAVELQSQSVAETRHGALLLRHVEDLPTVRVVLGQEQLSAARRSRRNDDSGAHRSGRSRFPPGPLDAARHSAQRPRRFPAQVGRLASAATARRHARPRSTRLETRRRRRRSQRVACHQEEIGEAQEQVDVHCDARRSCRHRRHHGQ